MSFRDGAPAPDRRCAIAHRGISRFRVRCCASPRNDSNESAMTVERTIGIAGAGSIGCFVGGMLAGGGRQVALLTLSEDPSIFSDAAVVLVTVKSADTAGIAGVIAKFAPHDAVIVSLQNGVGNVGVLRERLPGRLVLGGMVPFNVVSAGEGRFHRSTSGDIVIEADDAATAERLSVPGLKMRATA